MIGHDVDVALALGRAVPNFVISTKALHSPHRMRILDRHWKSRSGRPHDGHERISVGSSSSIRVAMIARGGRVVQPRTAIDLGKAQGYDLEMADDPASPPSVSLRSKVTVFLSHPITA